MHKNEFVPASICLDELFSIGCVELIVDHAKILKPANQRFLTRKRCQQIKTLAKNGTAGGDIPKQEILLESNRQGNLFCMLNVHLH